MNLVEEINEQNPWWSGRKIDIKGLVERDIFKELKEDMKRKEVSALIGLRRAGKTTLMKQLIRYLIEEGTDERNIFYFSFDLPHSDIKETIDTYFNEILGKLPYEEKTYIFLDEVHKVKEWSSVIKSYYDKSYPIKFFVSGSSSMNILRGSGESLVGRIRIHRLEPFSFREFLRYEGVKIYENNKFKIPPNAAKLRLEFEKYLKMGGFPESYEQNLLEYISNMTDLIIYRDIIDVLEVKRPQLLKDIFYSILEQSGNTVNYANISRDTGAKYETIKAYIDYLEMAFFISRSPLFPGKTPQKKKLVKIYAGDHAFLSLSPPKKGLIVETIVYNHLKHMGNLYYWHNSGEVDIVLKKGKEIIPIEVSISEKKSPKHLLDFMEKFKLKTGYIITDGDIRTDNYGEKEIVRIPAYLFLLNSSNLF
jgi:predicted AAA+ superfamily ATPase